MKDCNEVLRNHLDKDNFSALAAIANKELHAFIADAIELCEPKSVWVCTDSAEDLKKARAMAVELKEETPLSIEGHTIHFDGIDDQGRDREVTKYLVPKGQSLEKNLNQIEREEGLTEVRSLLKASMKNRTMIVRFLTLGPNNSVFSIPCVECTDSAYVSHSLDLLYRPGYEEMKNAGNRTSFFAILHSSGKLDSRMVSAESDKKRIYIDHTTERVYSVNTQYAGNTVGLKKLALRLAIRKADREGWLAEHMFLMGVKGPKGRKSFFAGAFPSACGKTSTAMLPGEEIIGDDLVYFRAINGKCRAVNAEAGIFGIIQNVNAKDDPAIWEVLTKPGELIFSNVLVNNGKPYWLGMGEPLPETGENFSGQWKKGDKDKSGEEIPPAHKNARYTVSLHRLNNCGKELNDPQGVELAGIVYGGRDANAYIPVQQSFSWNHGIVAYGAALETETTFATIGKEGVPEINLMSIQDFVSIPLGKYLHNNLQFGKKLTKTPLIFGVNYFLRNSEGNFLNEVRDKHIWIKWMELRIHGEADAIMGPTGWIPLFKDLAKIFKDLTGKEYTKDAYLQQFSIRIPENIAKMERVMEFHRNFISDAPGEIVRILQAQKKRLEETGEKCGTIASPEQIAVESFQWQREEI
jgi:phosphoenolpyruvate carboxykinase (GTP)